MDVDGDVPQEASVEIQSQKRKVIRVESEETQDDVRETLAISQRKRQRKWASCQVLSVNHEGMLRCATIDAVKKPSDTCRQFVSAVLQ